MANWINASGLYTLSNLAFLPIHLRRIPLFLFVTLTEIVGIVFEPPT